MFDFDHLLEIMGTLRKNLLRTFLTGLGVFLGIVIFLTMVGFGTALEGGTKAKMSGFAANAIYMWGQRTSMAHAGFQPGRSVEFDNRDIEALRRIPNLATVAPRNQMGGFMSGSNVRYNGKTGSFQVAGDTPEFAVIGLPLMRQGRFINAFDMAERRKVAVLGEAVVEQLYPRGVDPIGTYLEAQGVFFQVIGVFGTRQTGQQADRTLRTIHIPFTTFQTAFNFGERVSWFALLGADGASAQTIEDQARAVLAARHAVNPEDEQAIGAFNAGTQFQKMSAMFVIVNVVMWTAGLFTLAAGVVGVSNIMLISVRERTKEIGVRKALGATPARIVTMVVSEATLLTALAGYLGIVAGIALLEGIGWAISKAGSDVPFAPPDVGLDIAVIATVIIIVFGALAGLIPALHAAKIEPVEALRTE